METDSYSLWQKIVSKFTGEPIEYVACPTKHAFKDYRLNLLAEQDAVDYYMKCMDCGKEFRD